MMVRKYGFLRFEILIKMKNLLMIMVLVSIVTTKIMYANVVQIIVLDILSEKDLDGEYKSLLS